MRLGFDLLKKSWLKGFVIASFVAAIVLLMFLDYFNLESFPIFNDRGFYFDYTWKGRLFLLFFLWLLVLEYSLNLEKDPKKDAETPRNNIKLVATYIVAFIPIIYIISVNFLGFDQTVIQIGEALRGDYWKANFGDWQHILTAAWPLSLEYLMFTVSFTATILLAYGKDGLKKFGISLGLIAGITAVYLTDTIFPYGVLKPLQAMSLPTAAWAATFLDLLGYSFAMSYSPGPTAMPLIRTRAVDGQLVTIGIAWPCAGVHSMFLYILIILLLFKKSDMSRFRKLIYFIVGAIGTYLVNVLRIIMYFFIRINSGQAAAQTFHDSHGELLFVAWILLYILLIVCIQKFMLAEKTIHAIKTLTQFTQRKEKQQPTTIQ